MLKLSGRLKKNCYSFLLLLLVASFTVTTFESSKKLFDSTAIEKLEVEDSLSDIENEPESSSLADFTFLLKRLRGSEHSLRFLSNSAKPEKNIKSLFRLSVDLRGPPAAS